MTNTSDKKLVEKLIRNLDTVELIEFWKNLTNEFNAPSVIFDMYFFLKECLPECLSVKTIDSVNEYDIKNLAIDFINDYNLIEYSDAIKNKLAELKE